MDDEKEYARKRNAASFYFILGAVSMSLLLIFAFAFFLYIGIGDIPSIIGAIAITCVFAFFLSRAIKRKVARTLTGK